MLKLISKSFFVSILCGSLMLMDFSYKGAMINAAMAESVKTDKIDDADLMGTLTMTVAGTIASRLYSYKMTTDIMLAAAGGAIFLGGEVLAYLNLKEVMEGMEVQLQRDKKGNVNKEQIEALERLKKSYEEARETAETKKTLQMAAAAAFAAAGVMAYTMAATENANLATCSSAITASLASASAALSCSAATYGGCVPGVTACITAITTYSSAFMADELARQAVGPSAAGLATTTGTVQTAQSALAAASSSCAASVYAAGSGSSLVTACVPKHTYDILNESGGVGFGVTQVPPLIKNLLINDELKKEMITQLSIPNSKMEQYFTKAFNLIFPPAQAELFSAMGIASSAAISYILATSATIGPQIDMFLLIPQKRAIAWGILAGLTYAATSATENVINQIDQNISKIDRILQSMYQMANGATGTQTIQKPIAQTSPKPLAKMQFNATNYGEIDIKKETGDSLPCYTGNDVKNCKSFNESVEKSPTFKGLNIESQKQLAGILSTANGFNGTSKISSATLKGAASLAGSANALKVALEKAKAKNDEALKKAKSKFNSDEQTKKLSGIIDKKMRDGLKKSNSTPASMYAAMFGGKGNAASASDADKSKTADSKNAIAPTAGNVVDMSAPAGSGTDLGITGATAAGDKELSAEELAKINEQQASAAGKETIDQYDLKNDITNDSSSSIFELISNRYQKSGYPRLFKIKEPQTPAPVTK